MSDAAEPSATSKRKSGAKQPPPSKPSNPPPPGGRGGKREGAGRKSAALENGGAEAYNLYHKARAQLAAYQAKHSELDFKIKSGEYVPRAEVKQECATAYATIAQSLRSIPDNLERRLTVSPEIAEAVGLLIDEAMNDLAELMKRMASEVPNK